MPRQDTLTFNLLLFRVRPLESDEMAHLFGGCETDDWTGVEGKDECCPTHVCEVVKTPGDLAEHMCSAK